MVPCLRSPDDDVLGLFPGPTRLFFSRQGRETEDKGTRVVSSILACCFQASSCTSSSHPRSIPSRCPRSSQSLHIRSPPIEGRLVRIDLFFFPPPPGGLTQIPSLQPAFPPPGPHCQRSRAMEEVGSPPYGTPEGREIDHLAISTRVPLPGGRRRPGGGREGGGRGDSSPLTG